MNNFVSKDICVITPTKDRPHKIVNLLDSLVKQTQKVGRVIIVGSGENIESIIENYKLRLPIEYYHSEIAGQIRQRKLGISKLNDKTKLVATLDDDIILESDAIGNIIKFWNSKDEKTAGVGFNITNMIRHKYSPIRSLFFNSSKNPGKVLKSGVVTSIVNVKEDITSQWLNGGATIWRQNILIENIHSKNISAKWSPFEDLLFSYPIGKTFILSVCANAKVKHDDIDFRRLKISEAYYRGKVLILWMIYFILNYKDLSLYALFVSTIVSAIASLIRSIFLFRLSSCAYSIGRIVGLIKGIIHTALGKDITNLID